MAINAIEPMKPNNVATLACDSVADVQNLPQFSEDRHLGLGSSCIVVDSSEVYMQKSDYTWKKQ